jgi:DNA-directed RNA polymerase specialized sigma24 family protein
MSPKERIMFTLRFIEQMSLVDVAATTGYSLATVKRQVRKSRVAFMTRAGEDPWLATLIDEEDAG